jgi:hypothetical protein
MSAEQDGSWYKSGWWMATVGGATVVGTLVALVTLVISSLPPPKSSDAPVPTTLPPPTGLADLPFTTAQPVPTSAPTSTSPAQEPATLFDGEVRLELQTGADIEGGQKNGQIKGVYSEGISGSMDLYFDRLGRLEAAVDGVNGLYAYQGLEEDAQKNCGEIMNSVRKPPPAYPYPIETLWFCFRTSDNHVAWARVTGSNLNPSPYYGGRYARLRVKAWE